ncbi:MAG: hypothetical protein KDK25_00390 [Leptospiraceae bacterium]|nr:hypothetical protein [Leptospiraceae bacterium]
MNKTVVFTVLLSLSFFASSSLLLARAPSTVEPLTVQTLDVASRVHLGFHFSELDRHKYYERERSVYVSGEWAPTSYFSLYGTVPYVERTITDADKRRYLDHIEAGFRLAPSFGPLTTTLGTTIRFSRGTAQGDVPKDIGYIQPYLGLLLNLDWFYVQGSITWSTQTNPRFIEDVDQEFDRHLIYDLALGFRIGSLDLSLENRYDQLYDPEERRRVHWLLGPTVRWNVTEAFSMSLAVPYAIRQEREEDFQIHIRITYRFGSAFR